MKKIFLPLTIVVSTIFLAKAQTYLENPPNNESSLLNHYYSIGGIGNERESNRLKPLGASDLICKGNINLSLDTDCQVPLTAALTLVGNNIGGSFTFDIRNGTVSLGSIANASMVNKTLQFVVKDALGNSCWGNLTVEDKTPPIVTCPAPITLKCEEFDALKISSSEKEWVGTLPAGVVITDNCGSPKIFYSDNLENRPCTDPLSMIVYRTFRAVDAVGNSSSCVLTYNLQRRTLAEIVMPGNFDIECSNINGSNVLPNVSGSPKIGGISVFPSSNLLCGLSATYSDAITRTCGVTFKIVRTWIVTDCAGLVRTATQLINVRDTQAPAFDNCLSALLKIGATGNNCDLDNLILPFPTFKDNCDPNPSKSIIIRKGTAIIAAGFPVHDLALGNYTVEFVVTDICGNVGTCTQLLQVVDNVPPVAVCDQNTKISLTIDGTATMNATTLNDGSADNCCFDENSLVVKRSNEVDGSYAKDIKFTCKDTLVMVTLRVSDCNGNSNICMVNVSVEDKIKPVIVAQDTSVLCSNNANAKFWLDRHRPQKGSLLRFPSQAFPGWYENAVDCGYKIDSVDVEGIGACGTGIYTRTWTITDKNGLSATTLQKYTSTGTYDYNVKFPADILLNTDVNCVSQITIPDNTGRPIIAQTNESCANVAMKYSDEILDGSGNNVCYYIKRKWQIQNLCDPMTTFEPITRNNSGTSVTAFYSLANRGSFEYVQYIRVQDQNPPNWTKIPDIKVDAIGKDCKAKVTIERPEALDCTANLLYSFELYKSNGSLVQNGATFPVSFSFEKENFGNYRVIYRVSDRCGNVSSTTKTFTLKDVLKPTPVCHQNIAVSLGSLGLAMVQATAFDAGSNDNCTSKDKLKIRIRILSDSTLNSPVNPDTLPSMHTFRCLPSFIPFGGFLGYTKTVQLWVGDEDGNWDFCQTTIEVQDNMQMCTYEANEMRAISGDISTENGKTVENVKIKMEGLYNKNTNTPNSGKFAFPDLPISGFYTLIPEKTNNPLNGVSTYDLILMTKHILGVESLKSPYQLIAADVNKSGNVTTSDIVELRKMILGVQNGFNKNTSWRFIDKSFTFSNPKNPFINILPEQVQIKGLDKNKENQANFIAVKVGDVNQNANVSSFTSSNGRTNSITYFNLKDKVFAKNETFSVDFKPSDEIIGYQFTLNFENLELVDIQGNKENFASIENGVLTVSETKNDGFSLILKATSASKLSESIFINSNKTLAEAYNNQGQILDLGLNFNTKYEEFKLFQNQPNPLQQNTTIRFQLPESTFATLKITDISGKVIHIISGNYAEGINQINVEKSTLPTAGIYFYQLETATHKAVKKMIVVE
jgi:hypothetical protein